MDGRNNEKIPQEAIQAFKGVQELLGSALVGVYLFGSAVTSGLRVNSDVDVLVVVNQSLTEVIRRKLTDRLMHISGKIGNSNSVRPLEVTVINHGDVVPWRFPPKNQYIYGEWLRDELENGQIQEPAYDPDLAIVLAQVRKNSVSLFGSDASDLLEPVPVTHIRRAIMECLPGLIEGIKGDERNVILTLARMWLTVATGEISSKDRAAEWAIPQLPKEHSALLNVARKAYRGEYVDSWEGMDNEVIALVNHMKSSIESYL